MWGGIALAYALMVLGWVRGGALSLLPLHALGWAALVCFDIFGGIMTLATNSGKRRYNAPEARTTRARLTFLSLHAAHPAALAFLVLTASRTPLGFEAWQWFVLNVGLLYGLGAIIVKADLDIQRPIAYASFIVAIFLNHMLVPLPNILNFFVPLFFLKLFVCYLPVETPWRTRPPAPSFDLRHRAASRQ